MLGSVRLDRTDLWVVRASSCRPNVLVRTEAQFGPLSNRIAVQ